MTGERRLCVVIPTLNEAARLPALLGALASLDAEVVVSDGGSTDGTPGLADAGGARVVEAPRGRASQLRAGAAATEATWLFFLHADSRLGADGLQALSRFVATAAEDEFAHFHFRLDGERFFHRFIDFGQRLRERLTGLIYGDQGLVVSRSLYERVGGYPPWPILEDVGMLDRLVRRGRRVRLEAELRTSPRRYDAEGGLRGWLRNIAIITQFRLGVPPERIARRYPRPRSPSVARREGRAVVVFVRAPRPGRVKTRLAADVGVEEAVRVYRALGRATVDELRKASASLFVYYDPPDPDAEDEVAAWLGRDGLELRPQLGRDLGERMERALADCLGDAEEVCIVGSDVPDLGADTLSRAFAALSDHDVVIGPATDGGYYLLGLRAPIPELFRNVPWSTPEVLEITVERARAMGARVALLEPKTDVDTAPDVPPELLSA